MEEAFRTQTKMLCRNATSSEIASLLDCSIGTSKSQLHRARMRVRLLLEQRTHPSVKLDGLPGINYLIDEYSFLESPDLRE